MTQAASPDTIVAVKLTPKTRSTLFVILLLSMLIGTLSWEILERVLSLLGVAVDLTVGPLTLDAYVVAVTVRPNPGTLIGIAPGMAVFKRA